MPESDGIGWMVAMLWLVCSSIGTGCGHSVRSGIGLTMPGPRGAPSEEPESSPPNDRSSGEPRDADRGPRFDLSAGVSGGGAVLVQRGDPNQTGRGFATLAASVRFPRPGSRLSFGGGLRLDYEFNARYDPSGRDLWVGYLTGEVRFALERGWSLGSGLGIGMSRPDGSPFAGVVRVSAMKQWLSFHVDARLLVFEGGVPDEPDPSGVDLAVFAGVSLSLRKRGVLYTLVIGTATTLLVGAVVVAAASGNCPFVYLYDPDAGVYRFHGEIIRDQVGKAMEAEDRLAVPVTAVHDGVLRIQIREEKREVSRIDQLLVLVDGVPHRPRRSAVTEPLLARDGRYRVMRQGDAFELAFDLADVEPDSELVLVSSGYYDRVGGAQPSAGDR